MPARNTEGSIYRRNDGYFCASLMTPTGKRKYFYGNSEAEVKKKLKIFQEDSIRNNYAEVIKGTFEEYITNWFENDLAISLKPKSYETKKYTIDHHIIPALGDYQVGAIRRSDVQKLITDLSKRYSWSTVKKVYDAMNQCFKAGLIDRTVITNPVVGVKLPKKTSQNCRKIRYFSEAELKKILDTAVETYPNGTPVNRLGYSFHLLAFTGMRVGEAIALTWDDVDFDAHQINIDKNSVTVKNPDPESKRKYIQIIQDSAKTEKSVRVIPMSQKAEYALRKLRDVNGYFDTVSATSSGKPADHRDLARAFKGIQERAGIRNPGTLHSLRHTFATRLIERGVDIKIISELLGHADITITYNTYVHVIQKQKVQAIAELDDI